MSSRAAGMIKFVPVFLAIAVAVASCGRGSTNPDPSAGDRDATPVGADNADPADIEFLDDAARDQVAVDPQTDEASADPGVADSGDAVEEVLDAQDSWDALACESTVENPLTNCSPFTCKYESPFCDPQGHDLATLEAEVQAFYATAGFCAYPPYDLWCKLNTVRAGPDKLVAFEAEINKVPANIQEAVRCIAWFGANRGDVRVHPLADAAGQTLTIRQSGEIELGVSGDAVIPAFLRVVGPMFGAILGLAPGLELEVESRWTGDGVVGGGDIVVRGKTYKGIPVIQDVLRVYFYRIYEAPCDARVRFEDITAWVAAGLWDLDVDPSDEMSADAARDMALAACGDYCYDSAEVATKWPAWRGITGTTHGARVAWAVYVGCDGPYGAGAMCPCAFLIDAITGELLEPGLLICT